MKKKLVITIISLVSIVVNVPLSAQESCYERFLSEHNMRELTAEDADDSYEELKKEVIARQRMHEEDLSMPLLLAIDTTTGTCQILAQDGTILADAYLAMVDSTWYMWLSVDPLADINISNSPYMYCSGNPVMLIDPDGRFAQWAVGALVSAGVDITLQVGTKMVKENVHFTDAI